ncbi:MAG: alkaline phosphatase D family protein [Candidatus Palauibacterales bacterium]|jgi:alkaline phosphatase D|nr:alkaline phosphatase D family protein [Candidatus Palauibacterales bacterium]MDP2482690.1 alkaline phosphatase D family protein [Candidatus Palauibacterales bacterium]
MRRSMLLPFLMLAVSVPDAAAQQDLLQSGPMLGYSEMFEVLVWAQTTAPAEVGVVYWDLEDPDVRMETETVATTKAGAYTAKLIADQVQPGRHYGYELHINGANVQRPYPLEFQTQVLWQWRTDPPDFRIAAGSCFYVNDPPYDRPGEPYGGEFQILDAMVASHPDAMVWMGDNFYYREPDWNTRTGMIYRNTDTRSYPGLQPFLASVHQYATWDDHDYGPDNSDWAYREKVTSREVFDLFWGNPELGTPELGGITTRFEWGDVEFFLLDNRWFRSSEFRISGHKQVFGEEQLQWLVDALTYSRATFKIIVSGGQLLNPVAKWDSYATYPEERDRFLQLLRENEVQGVVLLSGDVHYTVLSKLDRPGTYPLWEISTSPITAGPASVDPETYENSLAEPGTLFVQRNFATLDFSGPERDRVLNVTVWGSDGEELWSKEIRARELRP